ncbi:TPA: urease accessory protein UreD [Escherichia coli]|uniref:urease accessory protein UreD n=1 Tax=Escherichia TaxID=561 RepID=UPI00033E7268|nr:MULTISPECIES: urease accessory protein UreD [Escherichia]EFN7664775.1 urease accessory protein [Escherichia coli]EOU49419.1 urease accessory protein ureD [Escherichia sp. KTE114]MBL7485892.1 urease accessory protein UreD [Escherichia coli]MCO0539138.1 urease accessory protein UreD [Escherichia coli]HBC8836935.1 urease accessory protein UreD [Escherichia coli]
MLQNSAHSRENHHTPGANAPELAQYQSEPAQMRSGAIGKKGYLKLRFVKREQRSVLAEMERRVPSMVQKALYWDEEMPGLPCVTMISTSGCILQGDRLETDIHVERGACAHITTQSATKVHMMNANYASQIQKFMLEENSYMEFMPDPLIPHRNSRFITDTSISIHPTATAIYSEVLMSGRKYHHPEERFGFDVFSSRVAAYNLSNKELFVERYILEPKSESLDAIGIMQHFDIFGNVILLTPKEYHNRILTRIPARFDIEHQIACGTTRLPNHCGLIFKVLGVNSAVVKAEIRKFWRVAREEILGITLPEKFIWR